MQIDVVDANWVPFGRRFGLVEGDGSTNRSLEISSRFGSDLLSRDCITNHTDSRFTHYQTVLESSGNCEEELYSDPSKVIWSSGGLLRRSFSFEDQTVVQAFWANFPSGVGSRQRSSGESERALCILLSSSLRIYFHDGPSFGVKLPFVTRRAWPMSTGIILERVVPEEQSVSSKVNPVLYTLLHPIESPRPLFVLNTKYHHDTPTHLEGVIFANVAHEVVYVSESSAYPILVTYSKSEKIHYVWSYSVRKSSVMVQPSPAESRRTSLIRRSDSRLSLDRASHPVRQDSLSGGVRLTYDDDSCFVALDGKEESQNDIASRVFVTYRDSGATLWMLRKSKGKLVGLRLPGDSDLDRQIHEEKCLDAISAVPLKLAGDFQARRMLALLVGGSLVLWFGPDVIVKCHPFGEILTLDSTKQPRDPKRRKFHIATRLDSRGGSEPDYPPRIVDIEHSVGGKATLVLEDSSRVRVQLRYAWRSLLVKSCVSALEIALPTHAFDVFFARFSRILSMPGESANSDIQSEWNAFVVNVLSFVLADTTEGFDPKPIPEWEQLQRSSLHARSTIASVLQPCKLAVGEKIEGVTFLAKHARRFASSDNEVVRPHLASIVISLHLIREDLRLDVSTIERLPFLNELLLFIAKEFQLPNHVRYYKNVSFTTIELVGFTGSNHTQLHEFMSEHPVDIMQWLNKKMTFQSVVDFPCLRMFSDLAHLSGDSYLEIPLSTCCANTRKICSFYNSLFATDGFFDDEALLMDMIKERFSRADLDMLPFGIAVPLLDSLRRSRLHPKQHWPLDAFILIGRQDLAEQLTASALVRLSKAHQKIEEKALSSEQGLWDSAKDGKYTQKLESGVEIQSDEVSNLRFPEDRRLEEVASMLDSSKCIETQLTDSNAADVTAEQQLVLQAFSSRTASLPLGRALFTYGTSTPEITEPLNIPQMQFSGKFIGHYGIVALDMQPFPPDFQDWCQFHNGVAAGLRISPEFTEIDSAWIQLNGRAEPSAEHAGLMLGFGLNGHLRKLVRGDTFQFLSQNYELMRIAMLLGYSASYCSSTDSQAYRLLSMHIPSLRPPRSELNVGPLTQTAAIMGIGLVFMGSLHRHMVETLLAELGRKEFPASVTVISTPPEVTANVFRETYSLTCGMALGMVALGRADEGSGLSDLSIVNELRRYIQGGRESDRTAFVNNSTVCFGRQYAVKESEKINVDVTAPGACIALAFMYMKSNNAVVAQLVGIPQTRFDLDYIRPDIIMLRVLCTNLIIWDDIRPSMEWVENLIPNFIKAGMEHDGRGSTNVPSGELQILTQAQDSIVAGACFSIALRFAGSANSSAYACLMAHFKRFKSQSTFVATTFEERLIKFARKACLDVVTMSLGILMAGSGSLSLMRTLRTLHARTSADVSFGSHAATHMALGLLFLGGGCYTIGTSNKAIAALVCAFFPRLPQHPTENRFHLQAIRHFWVLALEPRVLVTRDVETKAAVSTSVEVFSVNPIEKRGKLEKSVMMTPCLLPDLGMIRRITFRGTRFLPIDIVFTSSMTYRERLTRIRLVFLKRKSGYLDQFNEHGEGTRVKTTPFDFPGVITFESDENQLARPFPRSLATALAGCVGTLGTPITAVKTLWQIRQRRIARKDLVRSFSSDPILQDFAHYLCNLRGDTNDSYDDLESNAEFESERYFTEYAVAALYEALALDRSDGLVLFLDVYKCVERLFGSDCEPDPSDMWNLRYFLDYAKVCFEVKSRERERMRGMVGAKHDDSDENLFISLEFAKSLRARISLLIYLRRDVAPPDRLKDLEALLN